MKVIAVTGTPGTGKTTVAQELARMLKCRYVDVNGVIEEHNVSEGFDKKRNSWIIDAAKLRKVLVELINTSRDRGLVIDSHLSHYLDRKYVDICVVTKCNLKQLEGRLEERQYEKKKIRENLDAEIFDTCLIEARDRHHTIIVVDTTEGIKKEALLKIKREINDKSTGQRTE